MMVISKQKHVWFLPWLLTALFFVCSADHEMKEACNVNEIAQIINRLSHHLAYVIEDTGNVFFSPLSISVSLAMVYLGARGRTAIQMERKLGYNEFLGNGSTVHQHFHDMIKSLENGTDEYRLLVANGIYAQTGYEMLENYTSELTEQYNAKVSALNFSGDGIGSMKEINEWVSNHTEGKIKELIGEPLEPETKLILLNGIYFQGFWKYPFSEDFTEERNFYKTDGQTKTISFMKLEKNINYFEDEDIDYTFIELDYKGDHISMIFMLPKEKEAFPTLEVTSELLCNVRANFKNSPVTIIIPKFKLEFGRDLTSEMRAIRLRRLFSKYLSDLSGITGSKNLFVSSLVHKAVIELNEQGTEAAAASGVLISSRRKGPVQYEFLADHPFLFVIIDKRNGAILFTGRVSDP